MPGFFRDLGCAPQFQIELQLCLLPLWDAKVFFFSSFNATMALSCFSSATGRLLAGCKDARFQGLGGGLSLVGLLEGGFPQDFSSLPSVSPSYCPRTRLRENVLCRIYGYGYLSFCPCTYCVLFIFLWKLGIVKG